MGARGMQESQVAKATGARSFPRSPHIELPLAKDATHMPCPCPAPTTAPDTNHRTGGHPLCKHGPRQNDCSGGCGRGCPAGASPQPRCRPQRDCAQPLANALPGLTLAFTVAVPAPCTIRRLRL